MGRNLRKPRRAWKKAFKGRPRPIVVRLRSIRREQGITVEALSKKIGYHWTTISRWENGHCIPAFLALHDWCEGLGQRLTTLAK